MPKRVQLQHVGSVSLETPKIGILRGGDESDSCKSSWSHEVVRIKMRFFVEFEFRAAATVSLADDDDVPVFAALLPFPRPNRLLEGISPTNLNTPDTTVPLNLRSRAVAQSKTKKLVCVCVCV